MYDDNAAPKGIAHDVNGLIASLYLAAERLDTYPDQTLSKIAGRIRRASNRIVDICRAELRNDASATEITHLDSARLEMLITDVGQEALTRVAPARSAIDFSMRVSACAEISCNPTSLFRILYNLAKNAAAAMQSGEGGSLTINATKVGDDIHVSVLDTGPGIPDAVLQYLYPRADGAKLRCGRIGTGLITAAQLAARMGGELRLSRTDQRGTCFLLHLPATIAAG